MAKKYSFKQFLTTDIELIDNDGNFSTIKIDKISIPMIQRDYAQGRTIYNETTQKTELNTTGKKFISELFHNILTDSANKLLELDFVYGSLGKETTENNKQLTIFYPLDGQQRLTTLFLLYWFVGGAELSDKKELASILQNFAYDTRRSAQDFCKNLVAELEKDNVNFLLKQAARIDPDGKKISAVTIATQLKNLSWFHDNFSLDPTVTAMLNMLEEIQTIYLDSHRQNVFPNLERLQFYVLLLDNFDLTEDLYVKMNARGKQLTDFENFKADLQDWLKKNAADLQLTDRQYLKRMLPYDMFFMCKMDNEWSQCFWNLAKDRADKNFDPFYLDFFYKYLLNVYVLNYTENLRGIDKEVNFKELEQRSAYYSFNPFEKHLTKSVLEDVVTVLDNVANHYDEIIDACQPSWGTSNKFNPLAPLKELKDRTIFCSLVLYLKKKDFDKAALSKWMRVAWNVMENADIDNWSVAAGIMKLFDELAKHSDDIYKALADDAVVIEPNVASSAVAEERQKAKLIVQDFGWNDLLIQAESHPFFKGSVGFLIPDDKGFDGFKHNWEMAQIFFNKDGIAEKYQKDGRIFLRALLSKYQTLEDITKRTYHISDTYEKENSLKKRLSNDPVVRAAILEWFALPNEEEILAKLYEEVTKDSPIGDDNVLDRKLHESLYKSTDLIIWMREHGATRYQNDFISRFNSSYDWIYVRGYRNEIISRLLQLGWECDHQCRIGPKDSAKDIPYFWSARWRPIEVSKKEERNNETFHFTCNIGTNEISFLFNGDQIGSDNDYHTKITPSYTVEDFVNYIVAKFDELLPPTVQK